MEPEKGVTGGYWSGPVNQTVAKEKAFAKTEIEKTSSKKESEETPSKKKSENAETKTKHENAEKDVQIPEVRGSDGETEK